MSLSEFDLAARPTLEGLHRGALLLKAVQYLTQTPQPAYLNLALGMRSDGPVSGNLPMGGRIQLDLASGHLLYTTAAGAPTPIPLSGRSQAAVFDELFSVLADRELAGMLPAGGDIEPRVMTALAAAGRPSPPPPRTQLVDESIIILDRRVAQNYSQALDTVFTGLARFRAHLGGTMTPIVLWPHHFDLSTLWFPGNAIDEDAPHLNFGFAPFSAGIDEPYVYAYAYPYPAHHDPPAMPTGAHWHTTGWTGAVLPYTVIAAQANPITFIETTCQALFTSLQPLLHQTTGA
jgi:hypothetical protein